MADGMAYRFVKHPYDPIENGSLTSLHAEFLFQLFELFGDVHGRIK